MNLFSKFLKIISAVFPSRLTEKNAKLLSQLNPSRIYVENVRSLLGVSHAEAVRILETAVRQGVFEKRIGVLCPDGEIAASAESEKNLPFQVECLQEDEDGYPEETSIPTESLKKVIFYRLYERSDPISYSRTA
jgi:hypothetical protein